MANKRGRDLFYKVEPILSLLTRLFRLYPTSLLRWIWRWTDLAPDLIGIGLRYSILRAVARHCGSNVRIGPYVEILKWENLTIGNNVSIHQGCYIDATGTIVIGNEVSIAHHCSIMSTNHSWSDSTLTIRDNPVSASEVSIDDDVWIGCGSRILAGVHIGTRSVVAAGAVVTQNVPSYIVVGGVPARTIKQIEHERSS